MTRDTVGSQEVSPPPLLDVFIPMGEPPAHPLSSGQPSASLTARVVVNRALAIVADRLERHAWIVITVFALAFYVPLSTWEARNVPLIHDEIFTVHIAQAPDLRSMLALRREIDLHPPLHYLLERASLRLPAPRWFSSRLPSIVAGAVTLLALFGFTARRLGVSAAFVAVAVFWFGPLPESAWTNRPYMLWYALLALLMLAWSRAAEPLRPPLRLALVASLSFLLALTHLFGLACLIPFVVAEVVRGRRLGRLDWPLLLALAAPLPIAAMALFQVRHLGANAFPASNLPSFGLAAGMYFNTITNLFYVFGGCALALGLLVMTSPALERAPGVHPAQPFLRRSRGLLREDRVLLLSLLALPVPLMLAGSLVHIQFWARYGFFVVLPLAVLIASLLQSLFGARIRLFAVLVTAALFLGAIARFAEDQPQTPLASAAFQQPGVAPLDLQHLDPALPIVAAGPMTFVEMSDREAASITARTYYLTDRDGALRFSGYTLFDNEAKIRSLLHLPSQTSPLNAFLAAHPRFYVIADYSSPAEWLPRDLLAHRYVLQYLGKLATTYDDHDLFLVSPAGSTTPAGLGPAPASLP